MARAKHTIQFALNEEDDVVRAVLSVDEVLVLNLENQQAPRVIERHPKMNKREFRELAERDRGTGKPAAVLDRYIASREKDMLGHMLDIRKALRRIAGAMRNANIARKVKRDLAG
ncbi:MAG TPA: hypothetical protein VJO34_08900 [Methylomirabilota bacterium]|nr:hypothetical protein [Methylomirabilota bacterium]